MEKPLGSRPDEELPPPHSPEKDIDTTLTTLLRTKGIDNEETENAFHVWEEFYGLEKIEQDNDIDAYIKLFIKKAELFAEAGFTNEALDILENILIMSKANDDLDRDIIETHIDNLSR